MRRMPNSLLLKKRLFKSQVGALLNVSLFPFFSQGSTRFFIKAVIAMTFMCRWLCLSLRDQHIFTERDGRHDVHVSLAEAEDTGGMLHN